MWGSEAVDRLARHPEGLSHLGHAHRAARVDRLQAAPMMRPTASSSSAGMSPTSRACASVDRRTKDDRILTTLEIRCIIVWSDHDPASPVSSTDEDPDPPRFCGTLRRGDDGYGRPGAQGAVAVNTCRDLKITEIRGIPQDPLQASCRRSCRSAQVVENERLRRPARRRVGSLAAWSPTRSGASWRLRHTTAGTSGAMREQSCGSVTGNASRRFIQPVSRVRTYRNTGLESYSLVSGGKAGFYEEMGPRAECCRDGQ